MDLQQRWLGNSISDRFIDGETDPIGWLFGGGGVGSPPPTRITAPTPAMTGSLIVHTKRNRAIGSDEPGSPDHGACWHNRDLLPKSRKTRIRLSHGRSMMEAFTLPR